MGTPEAPTLGRSASRRGWLGQRRMAPPERHPIRVEGRGLVERTDRELAALRESSNAMVELRAPDLRLFDYTAEWLGHAPPGRGGGGRVCVDRRPSEIAAPGDTPARRFPPQRSSEATAGRAPDLRKSQKND